MGVFENALGGAKDVDMLGLCECGVWHCSSEHFR